MTKRRLHAEPRRLWTPAEDAQLRALYPDTPMPVLRAALPGRSARSIYQRAATLELRRSDAYLASPAACRLRRGENVGKAHQFQPGHVPANKGLRRPGWSAGRMRETQFRKGERHGVAAQRVQPIGTERVNRDGYRERKINDDLPLQRRWRAVHLLLWESVHGPLPPVHAVVFVNGDRRDIRLENLRLVNRAELMRRNSVHNLPAPLVEVVQLRGALVRQINRRARREEASHAE